MNQCLLITEVFFSSFQQVKSYQQLLTTVFTSYSFNINVE